VVCSVVGTAVGDHHVVGSFVGTSVVEVVVGSQASNAVVSRVQNVLVVRQDQSVHVVVGLIPVAAVVVGFYQKEAVVPSDRMEASTIFDRMAVSVWTDQKAFVVPFDQRVVVVCFGQKAVAVGPNQKVVSLYQNVVDVGPRQQMDAPSPLRNVPRVLQVWQVDAPVWTVECAVQTSFFLPHHHGQRRRDVKLLRLEDWSRVHVDAEERERVHSVVQRGAQPDVRLELEGLDTLVDSPRGMIVDDLDRTQTYLHHRVLLHPPCNPVERVDEAVENVPAVVGAVVGNRQVLVA
jgi:hypothetical protein